jgi:serine/threonine protein kinase
MTRNIPNAENKESGTDKTPGLQVSDHELLRCIGSGSYGEVWLSRSVMGTYRAAKVVYREKFDNDHPFEREWLGIQKFEPISRTHPGLVSILHIGRPQAGYFYYVMEIADDMVSGQNIDTDSYSPKTLSRKLTEHGKLPLKECLDIGISLTAALQHLHNHGLIHRDIKPSNIIFVNGAPKFADIGLVTEIDEKATFVGTPGYIAPEGPGNPAADLYSLGKVLYEISMGKDRQQFPELPTDLDKGTDLAQMMRFNELLLKACEPNPHNRFPSAEKMQAALSEIAATVQQSGRSTLAKTSPDVISRIESSHPDVPTGTPVLPKSLHVSILYKSNVQPDVRLLELLNTRLTQQGCQVFFDKHLAIGVEWAREIENRIRNSDAAIVLLSALSIQSEMIAYEVEIADQAAQQQGGKPRLLPVRINYTGPLPSPLASILDPLHYFLWGAPSDDARLVRELFRALETSPGAMSPGARLKLESIGGAVPLDSRFYVVRPTDNEFQSAIVRRDSIVLVKGARQMGKTSLLARGLQQARESGAKVVLTDFQKLNTAHLASVDAFFLTLGDFLADQLDLEVLLEDAWDKRRSPNTNFERYLRREVLGKISSHFVWGLDEVDRLFTCDFGGEVFGLFRSWHNERALDPDGPWSRLTLAIAYATEAHLFITDVNQSPFNVGTRLALDDFNLDQVADLNRRYGSPLRNAADIRRFFALVGGQPYLVRRGLNEMATGNISFADFTLHADRDEGMFGDHLRRILVLLAKDPELTEVVRGILRGQPSLTATSFYRLRSAGVMSGDSPQQIRPRCEIYASYLKRHLL